LRLTLTQIDHGLIYTNSGGLLPQNLIAVAVNINSTNIADHAALLIGVNGVYYLCHFLNSVSIDSASDATWLFHKQLDIIDQEESETFLWHCEKIKEKSRVKFGFMFDGSYYDNNGEFFKLWTS
jgi:hypothetical protein